MTELKCSVHSCANHKDNMCCKSNIAVSGKDACCCDETCCSSYSEKGDENNMAYTEPNRRLDISCSARECMYNHNSVCRADNVSINNMSGGAVCSTFVKR